MKETCEEFQLNLCRMRFAGWIAEWKTEAMKNAKK